jgi:hypothetical protein
MKNEKPVSKFAFKFNSYRCKQAAEASLKAAKEEMAAVKARKAADNAKSAEAGLYIASLQAPCLNPCAYTVYVCVR